MSETGSVSRDGYSMGYDDEAHRLMLARGAALWADDVQGRALDCGHFLPEEAPEETYTALRAFFAE